MKYKDIPYTTNDLELLDTNALSQLPKITKLPNGDIVLYKLVKLDGLLQIQPLEWYTK